MESNVPRVVALLDEVKGELSNPHVGVSHPKCIRWHDKITQAQNLLVGGGPVRPEDN